ncbi:MAG: L,D-transpeptidase [Synergistaceae bacterium]|nr:L,D-transpeptidase [Synergistaceae bacterium]
MHHAIKKLLAVMAIAVALGFVYAQTAPAASVGKTYAPSRNELWIKIDKNKLRLYLFKGNDTILKSYPIAIGRGVGTKKSRTDLITPTGLFKIWRVVDDATQLVYDPKWFGEPGEPQKGAYGAKLISFYNPWEIAIHGTNAPGSIGKRVTHGCVRLRNKDIIDLTSYVKPGMRLLIVEKIVENDAI